MAGKSLIKLEEVTLRIRGRHVFTGSTWEIRSGEHWALTGPNGSGKSTLAGALTGATPVVAGRVRRLQPSLRVSHVSPETYRSVIAADHRLDAKRHYSGKGNSTVGAELLDIENDYRTNTTRDADAVFNLAHRFGIGTILDRSIRALSSGEIKKLLLVRALSKKADLYVFDEPFDGLDSDSRRIFEHKLVELMESEASVVLITHRIEEILPGVTHTIAVRNCRITESGRRSDESRLQSRRAGIEGTPPAVITRSTAPSSQNSALPIVEIRNATIQYEERYVFRDFSWRINRGESWCLLGPNGSGKTTLLDLIYGENPLSYANDVRVFGQRRGDGESIWHLRRRLGIVTPYLQSRHKRRVLAFDVVVSGFFDSIGLYRIPTTRQRGDARRTATALGIDHLGERPFEQLSSGERMLILIGRAMVKPPDLLILDEPCQGLDREHRAEVVRLVDSIVRSPATDVIYVTHLADEIPESISRVLNLSQNVEAGKLE